MGDQLLQVFTLIVALASVLGVCAILVKVGRLIEQQSATRQSVGEMRIEVGSLIRQQAVTTAHLDGINGAIADHQRRIERLEQEGRS